MFVIVDAVLDGVQWDAPRSLRRTSAHVDVVVETVRPVIGSIVEGVLAELVDPDSYEARRLVAVKSFGGEAYLVVGRRAPAERR